VKRDQKIKMSDVTKSKTPAHTRRGFFSSEIIVFSKSGPIMESLMADVVRPTLKQWERKKRGLHGFQMPVLAEQMLDSIWAGRFDEVDLPEDAIRLLQITLYVDEERDNINEDNVVAELAALSNFENDYLMDLFWFTDSDEWRSFPEFFQALVYTVDKRELVIL
jgi:hypothetical protein